MKILFITAEGFDTPNPNNQMAETMINDFLDHNHSVHLVQSHRKGINSDIPISLVNRKLFTADTVVRNVVNKSHFVKRFFNEVIWHFLAFKYWKRIKDADIIYLQSNPTIYISMLLLKIFKYRTPFVYSIYDIFPGEAYDVGIVKSKLLYDSMKIVHKICYRLPNALFVLSEDMKETAIREGANAEDVYVVPAWYDVRNTKEVKIEENRFINKYNISKNKFYVQFAGSIGYIFNYKTIIELARRLANDKDIVFQMIGDGTTKEAFVKEAQSEHLDNIKFYPLQPIEIVPDVYSACNICIIPLMKGVIANGTPSKAPILMACRRVIINSVEKSSHYSKIFKEHNMGISADIEDYDTMVEAIKFLKNHKKEREVMAENAYNYGKDYFSSTRSIGIILKVFEKYCRKY